MKRVPQNIVLSCAAVLLSGAICWGARLSHDRYAVAEGQIARITREAKARGETPSPEQLAQLPSAEAWYQWSSTLSVIAMIVCVVPIVMVIGSQSWRQRCFAIVASVITLYLWWRIPSWRS
jgi:hypothetical protein